MVKIHKPISKFRSIAFRKQGGRCFYCRQPMWVIEPNEILSTYKITSSKINLLKCTAEHLTAVKDGGETTKNNIVAACWFCNQRRHKRKTNPSPKQYKQMVQSRLGNGRWHGINLV